MASKKATVDLSRVDVSKLSKKDLKALTNKKQRQELKNAKKSQQRKTETDRAREVSDTQKRMRELELDEKYEAVRKLFGALESFVATGETACGKIPFPECQPYPVGRTIVYNFTNLKGHKGTCDLIINGGQEYLDKDAAEATHNTPDNNKASDLDKFQAQLEQAMESGTLFPPGAGEGIAKVVESLLEQAKRPPPTDNAAVEVIE